MIIDRDRHEPGVWYYDTRLHPCSTLETRLDIEDWYTQAVVYRVFVYIIMVITCLVDKWLYTCQC